MIIKGKLKINYVSDTGKQFVQRIFNTGSITGIVPLLLQSNHESSCEAVGNTEVIQLRIEELLHLLTDRPNISIELMRQLSFSVRWGELMASGVLLAVPPLVIFTLLNKYFVAGQVSGAIKE